MQADVRRSRVAAVIMGRTAEEECARSVDQRGGGGQLLPESIAFRATLGTWMSENAQPGARLLGDPCTCSCCFNIKSINES